MIARWLCAFAIAGTLGSPLAAQASSDLVLRGATVWTGSTLIPRAVIVIGANGKVVAVGGEELEIPAASEVIDLTGRFITPGLIDADGQVRERTEAPSVQSGVVAGEDFDPHSFPRTAMQSGVSVVYWSPGRNRLVPGQGSAVSARPYEHGGGAVRREAALHTVLTESALSPPPVFRPAVPPGPENPVEAAKPQMPTTRAGARSMIRELFAEASARLAANRDGSPADEWSADLRPVIRVLKGELAWRVRAHREEDIRFAIEIAEEHRLRLVVEGGREAWKLAADLARIQARLVLEVGIAAGSTLPAPAPFENDEGEGRAEAAAILKRAGVTLALVPSAPAPEHDLLWFAAQAVSPGFSSEDALSALTRNAGQVLGIESGVTRVGGIADLAIFDRHPFAPGASAESVVLGRKLLSTRPVSEAPKVLALKVGKIYPGDGEPISPGTVLVRGDKIVALGKDISIPDGAQIHEFPNAVLTPGFVDAGAQLGYRSVRQTDAGEVVPGAGLPALGMDQRASDLFDASWPDVAATARRGTTAAALTPNGGRLLAGWLSVVKLGGPKESRVVKPAAGLLLDLEGLRATAEEVDKIRKAFEAGQKYVESWEKYEKELKAWKAKQKPVAAIDAPALAPVRTPAARDPLVGTWKLHYAFDRAPRELFPAQLLIRLEGDAWKAEFSAESLPGGVTIAVKAWSAPKLELEASLGEEKVKVELHVRRDALEGRFDSASEGGGTILGMRTDRTPPPAPKADKPTDEKKEKDPASKEEDKKPASGSGAESKSSTSEKKAETPASAEAKKDDSPKPPRVSAADEPFKDLIAGDLPVFVRGSSQKLTREVLRLLRDELEVRTVLIGDSLIPSELDLLDELGVAVATDGVGVRWEAERHFNAYAAVVQKGLPLLFRSGVRRDPRTLLATAAYSVHRGLSPKEALRALTSWSALVLNVQDRLGQVARGKDADFVLFDGEPFAPETRILKVMVGGEFVAEEKP